MGGRGAPGRGAAGGAGIVGRGAESFLRRSALGGTTGRAAGCPARVRDCGAPGTEVTVGIPPEGRAGPGTSACRVIAGGFGIGGAAILGEGRKVSPVPEAVAGKGCRGPERICPGRGAPPPAPGKGFAGWIPGVRATPGGAAGGISGHVAGGAGCP